MWILVSAEDFAVIQKYMIGPAASAIETKVRRFGIVSHFMPKGL
jgi:hypothetical protein